jgi:PAS domain S-box-containing protein
MHHISEVSITNHVFGELEQSEERFRAIFENAAVGIGIFGLDRQLIDANPILCRMFGMTKDELIGPTPLIVMHPDDYSQSAIDFQEFLSGNRDDYQSERSYMRKDGGTFWAHVTMSLIRNVDNVPLYIIAMVLDIDEKKRAQLALRQSEERFRAIFESSAIGMGLLAADGKIMKVNEAVCKIAGYSAEELQQRYDQQNVYPEDLEIGQDLLAEVLVGKRDSYEVERRHIRKNGEVFWARLTISAVRNPDDSLAYLVGMIEDIDSQKRTLAELEESEARSRAMFDNAMIGMTLSTLDRRVLQINEALARITGYSMQDLKSIHPSDLAYPEDRHLGSKEFAELIAGKRNEFSLERRYFHKSGRIFWGRVNYSLVRNSNGEPCYLVGLFEDISDQKLASERIASQEAEHRLILEEKVEERTRELKQINERLEEEIAQRQKAEQALAEKAAQDAILSERTRLARDLHDAVTQTLFSASLIAEVLPDLWKINQAEGEKRLEELRQLTRGALAEMRTLLVELRPNALIQIPLPDLLRQLCESLIGRARLPIQFIAEGQAKIPPDAQIAFYRITQEALNNIVKHAKATRVIVTLQMEDSVRLVIVDDGSGFDPTTISPDHLGLKIMCERAESIGANCSIYSQPGEGTQISVKWQFPDEKG